jgi:hypothetical protein
MNLFPRRWVLPIFLTCLVSQVQGQTVDGISLFKGTDYQQTDPYFLENARYHFDAKVTGSNLEPLPNPLLSLAAGSTWDQPWNFDGALEFVYDDEAYHFTDSFDNSRGGGYLSEDYDLFEDYFPEGTYTLTIAGTPVALDLVSNYLPNAPELELTGGYWDDGKYIVPVVGTVGVVSNAYLAFDDPGQEDGRIILSLTKYVPEILETRIASELDDNYIDAQIDMSSIWPHDEADISVSFQSIVDTSSAVPGVEAEAYFETSTTVTLATPPDNDNWEDAWTIYGLDWWESGRNYGATMEWNEPGDDDRAGRSVWWKWVANFTGPVFVAIREATFTTLLSVFEGTDFYTMDLIDSDQAFVDPIYGMPSEIMFDAVEGQTYYFAVDGVWAEDESGEFSIEIQEPIPPDNDSFANAEDRGSNEYTYFWGNNYFATEEPDEPEVTAYEIEDIGGSTVWFKWTAPYYGRAVIDSTYNVYNSIVAVYTGATLGTLTEVAVIPDWEIAEFEIEASQTYYIAVNGSFGDWLNFNFSLSAEPISPNNNFASAVNLGSGATATDTEIYKNANLEDSEPESPGEGSTWWRWTAPGTALVSVNTLGSTFDTILEVFTGTNFGDLQRVRLNRDTNEAGTSRVCFFGQSGVTYHFRVTGERGDTSGDITIGVESYGAPSTAAAYIRRGRAYLEEQTDSALASAVTDFTSALSLSPGNEEALFLLAITKVARLEQQTAFANALTGLGLVDSTLWALDYDVQRDVNGDGVGVPGANSQAGLNYLVNTLLPAMSTLRADLAGITSPGFLISLSDTEDSQHFVKVDLGDVKVLRAVSYAMEAVIRLLQTYKLGFEVENAVDLANEGSISIKSVLGLASDLLEFSASDQRTSLKTAIQQTNTAYQDASAHIRASRLVATDPRHLFPLYQKVVTQEKKDREALQYISSSLNGQVSWGTEPFDLTKYLSTTESAKDLMPTAVGSKFAAGTIPDPTFDTVAPGMTQAKVEAFFEEHGLLADLAYFSDWAGALLTHLDVSQRGLNANPDNDFYNNYLEWAFNLDPTSSTSPSEVQQSAVVLNPGDNKQYLTLTFVRRISAPGVVYRVEVSSNLTTWDNTGAQLQQVGSPIPQEDGITEQVTFRVIPDISQLVGSRYMRLAVEGQGGPP